MCNTNSYCTIGYLSGGHYIMHITDIMSLKIPYGGKAISVLAGEC